MHLNADPRLSWVTFADVEHFTCEYHKYVLIAGGSKRKDYKHDVVKQTVLTGAGFIGRDGLIKKSDAIKAISKAASAKAKGHRGVFVRPKTAVAAKRVLKGRRAGGKNSGYLGKSSRRVLAWRHFNAT